MIHSIKFKKTMYAELSELCKNIKLNEILRISKNTCNMLVIPRYLGALLYKYGFKQLITSIVSCAKVTNAI